MSRQTDLVESSVMQDSYGMKSKIKTNLTKSLLQELPIDITIDLVDLLSIIRNETKTPFETYTIHKAGEAVTICGLCGGSYLSIFIEEDGVDIKFE